MPIIFPKNFASKIKIVSKTKNIVKNLMKNKNYDFSKIEEELNEIFYDIYSINESDRSLIEIFSKKFYEEL